jgi:hypothetical protein
MHRDVGPLSYVSQRPAVNYPGEGSKDVLVEHVSQLSRQGLLHLLAKCETWRQQAVLQLVLERCETPVDAVVQVVLAWPHVRRVSPHSRCC